MKLDLKWPFKRNLHSLRNKPWSSIRNMKAKTSMTPSPPACPGNNNILISQHIHSSNCNCTHSGPMLALCLAREEAVSEWRKLLGPKIVEKAEQEDPES